jgi:uncharacterized membrane protein YgdD (TMEM256/DUF423 family)
MMQRLMMQRLWIGLGSLAGLTAVAFAAFTAHGLRGLDQARLTIIHTAVEMQAWHALALLACGLWGSRGGSLADGAGAAFALGTLLFCGSLYSHALYALDLGIVAPIGGTLLMLGWMLLGLSAFVARQSP